jgi:hypothetical protein
MVVPCHHSIRAVRDNLLRQQHVVAKVDEVGAEAQIDYRRGLDHIKDKHALVQSRINAYKAANGQKWESFKGGVETAWHELADAFKAIKQ